MKGGDRKVEDRSSKLDNINDFLDQYPIKVNQDETDLNILTGGDNIQKIDDSRIVNDDHSSNNVLSTRQNDNITKLLILDVTKKHERSVLEPKLKS